MGVTSIVIESGGSEDEAIAALLHDSAEDQGGYQTLDRIRSEFGDAVAGIVEECSDHFGEPRPPWRERKEAYIGRLEHASTGALRVSLADKVHNMRTILRDYRTLGEPLWDRFNAERDDVLWYYGSLAEVFSRRHPGPLAVELAESAVELERLIDVN
jgi:(p)ppGpp synthase/HD superfamily hydrolase